MSVSCAEASEADGQWHRHHSLARSPTSHFSTEASAGHWQLLSLWYLPPPPQPGTPRVSSGGKCFSQGLDARLTVASLGLEKQLWKVGAAGALLER